MHPKICIISSCSPYDGERAREALDFALASVACSIPTALLFIGEAVLQLSEVKCDILGKKNISSLIAALPVYGIDTIYVDAVDVKAFNVKVVDHDGLNISYLTSSEIANLLSSYDKVINL
jgi:tRNA 2-thiouridine synthesizing protein C